MYYTKVLRCKREKNASRETRIHNMICNNVKGKWNKSIWTDLELRTTRMSNKIFRGTREFAWVIVVTKLWLATTRFHFFWFSLIFIFHITICLRCTIWFRVAMRLLLLYFPVYTFLQYYLLYFSRVLLLLLSFSTSLFSQYIGVFNV